jgi:hypothetical protein
MSESVVAIGIVDGRCLTATAVNPGEWFGRTWLVSVSAGQNVLHYVIEANSLTNASDMLSESVHGHVIRIQSSEYLDFGVETDEPKCCFDGKGQPYDPTVIMSQGRWDCWYFKSTEQTVGIEPAEYLLLEV